MKKMIRFFLALVGISIFLPLGNVLAAENTSTENDAYNKAYELATIIENNTEYDNTEKIISFNSEKAMNDGLDKETAYQLENYFNSLSPEEAEETYNEMLASGTSTYVIPAIIVSAAKILAKAGLSWLAKKLLDWGSAKFCAAYKNSNSVTKNVCNFLGE